MTLPELRIATPADYPAVLERHREQNERDGTNYPLPRWFDDKGELMPNIAIALVAELDGEVLQGIYFEVKQVEMCFAGCDPRATAVAQRTIDAAAYLLKSMGYTGIHSLVPKVMVEPIEKPLDRAKFIKNEHLVDFYRDLGGEA